MPPPHPINLVRGAVYVPEIRKHTGGEVVEVIPPSGVLLNAKFETVPVAELSDGVVIAGQKVVGCDEIPEEAKDCDIVSALYASAYRKLHGEDGTQLVTIMDVVVESAGNPTPKGCRGFALA